MKINNKKVLYFSIVILVALNIFYVVSVSNINGKINRVLDSEYQVSLGANSPKRLLLQGAYGDNQSYHPKVLSFDKEWNGYKYWMSFTPYPNADSSKENPHVKASNDMINWVEPKKGINPLDEVENTEDGKRYNSDSHLVYNNDKNELECWWRFVDDVDDTVTIFRRTTKDGKNWTEKEAVLKGTRSKEDWISPAIIYQKGYYKIWYVNDTKVYYTKSKDLKDFYKPRKLDIEFEELVNAWHLDVIHTKKGYEMIIVAFSDWDHRAIMNLYYTYSKNNKDFSTAQVILKPTTGTNYWDNSGLYRSSFIYENGKYYVFYSGQGLDNAKGIGLMYGKDIFKLRTVNY